MFKSKILLKVSSPVEFSVEIYFFVRNNAAETCGIFCHRLDYDEVLV